MPLHCCMIIHLQIYFASFDNDIRCFLSSPSLCVCTAQPFRVYIWHTVCHFHPTWKATTRPESNLSHSSSALCSMWLTHKLSFSSWPITGDVLRLQVTSGRNLRLTTDSECRSMCKTQQATGRIYKVYRWPLEQRSFCCSGSWDAGQCYRWLGSRQRHYEESFLHCLSDPWHGWLGTRGRVW